MRVAGLLLTAAALAAVAGSLPAPALLAPAAGLALVTVSAMLAVALASRRLAVSRTVLERELREDELAGLRFDARGLGRLPVLLEVEALDGGWVPLGARGGELSLCLRRGAHRLGPSRLRLRDVLGICSHGTLAGEPEGILVLPAPDPLTGAFPTGAGPADDLDPDGLAPYIPGTPLARVHWRGLARGNGLHVRRVAAPPRGRPLVVVSTAGLADADAVDREARAAAGRILQLSRTGGCNVLLPGDESPTAVADAAAWRAVHRRLAALSPHGGEASGIAPRRWRRR